MTKSTSQTLLRPPKADPQKCVLYSVSQAATLLGLSRTGIYAELTSQRLPSFKIGRRRMIASSDLNGFIAKLRQASQRAAHV